MTGRTIPVTRTDDSEVASEATQELIKAKTDNLDIALSALRDALRGSGSKTNTDIVTELASIGGASAAAAGDTGASTTNGFLRWMRDFWFALKGTKTAANSVSVTGASDSVFYVGGVSADGVAPTNQAVRVSGVDGGGLKRTLLTDSSGRQFVVMPDSTQTDMTFNSTSDIYTFDMTNYQSWSIQVTTPGGGNSLAWEFQDDGASSSWIPGIAQGYTSNGTLYFGTGVNPYTYASICGQKRGRYLRIRCSIFGTGPVVAKFTQMSSNLPGVAGVAVTGFSAEGNSTLPNPVVFGVEARTSSKTSLSSGTVGRAIGTQDGRAVFRPHAIPENEWTYAAAASGIVNTTSAVTIKAQAGANVRNYITSVQIMAEALTNATELAIRDGASGTVLWRTKIGTSGLPHTNIIFNNPLKGTANTLLEVVTLTASGAGAVYFNAQGYIGP